MSDTRVIRDCKRKRQLYDGLMTEAADVAKRDGVIEVQIHMAMHDVTHDDESVCKGEFNISTRVPLESGTPTKVHALIPQAPEVRRRMQLSTSNIINGNLLFYSAFDGNCMRTGMAKVVARSVPSVKEFVPGKHFTLRLEIDGRKTTDETDAGVFMLKFHLDNKNVPQSVEYTFDPAKQAFVVDVMLKEATADAFEVLNRMNSYTS
jgi:hypothetical protein